jgi:hypothetical protein
MAEAAFNRGGEAVPTSNHEQEPTPPVKGDWGERRGHLVRFLPV